jgi:hypothetical protein
MVSQTPFAFSEFLNEFFLGGHREGETPDPIPNSEVKPLVANGTALKSAGE